MSWPPFLAALAVVAAATSAALTRLWIVAAADWGFVDPPNPLVGAHRQATVSMGGAAVALAALSTGLGAFLVTGGIPADDAAIGRVAVGALAFLLLGMVDDALRLSARSKLAAQIGIATWFVAAGGTYPVTGHAVLDACLGGLSIVTVVNAVNLTDVSDGLVAGLAAIASRRSSSWPHRPAPASRSSPAPQPAHAWGSSCSTRPQRGCSSAMRAARAWDSWWRHCSW